MLLEPGAGYDVLEGETDSHSADGCVVAFANRVGKDKNDFCITVI